MIDKPQNEILRRIELLARVIGQESLSKTKTAEDYNVEEVTITRDLQFLRANGIEIFSQKNGIKLYNQLSREALCNLASEYIALKLHSDIFFNSITKYSKIKPDFFPILVIITKAVKESRMITVKYQRLSDDEENDYTLLPLKIVENNNNWTLHAIKEGEKILKTFYLSRVKEVRLLSKKFNYRDTDIGKQKKVNVVLKFIPEVEREIYFKIWFDEFEIEKDNHSIILRTKQPITNQLAAWCISWWDAIEIVEPKELKEYIKEMIKHYEIKNY